MHDFEHFYAQLLSVAYRKIDAKIAHFAQKVCAFFQLNV